MSQTICTRCGGPLAPGHGTPDYPCRRTSAPAFWTDGDGAYYADAAAYPTAAGAADMLTGGADPLAALMLVGLDERYLSDCADDACEGHPDAAGRLWDCQQSRRKVWGFQAIGYAAENIGAVQAAIDAGVVVFLPDDLRLLDGKVVDA